MFSFCSSVLLYSSFLPPDHHAQEDWDDPRDSVEIKWAELG